MNQLIPLLDKAMSALAEKLGVGIDVLWTALINQAGIMLRIYRVEMTVSIIVGVMLLGLSILGLVIQIKNEWEEVGWGATAFCSALGVVIMIFIYFDCYARYLTALHNPHYWAIKQILGAIKS